MTRPFPHLGGYYDVPDEEKKKRSSLFVIAALIWPLSTTLKTLTLSWCYHSKQCLKKEKCDWCHQRWQRHYFPFSRSSTETWCDTLNLKNQKAQVWYFYKYCHVSTNIVYFQVSHAVDKNASMWISLWKKESKGERQTTWEKGRKKTKSKNRETTEVVGDHQLPFEPTEQGDRTHNSWQSKWA